MTAPDVAALVERIAALWPAWRLPTTDAAFALLVHEWEGQLVQADFDHALAAVRQAQADGREWPPGPGEVNLAALRLAGVPLPPEPMVAWAEVEGKIQTLGRYVAPCWSHPAVGEAVRAMGGWGDLCASEMLETDRAHWPKVYAPIALAHTREAVNPTPEPLAVGPGPVPVAALGERWTSWRMSQQEADRIGKRL